jgi:hypothetical protein
MNAAFLTWTVVLGGWVLPEVGPPEMQRAPGMALPTPRMAAGDLRGGAVKLPQQSPRQPPVTRGPSPYVPREPASAMSPSHTARHQMPAVPTAADAGAAHPGQHYPGAPGAMPYGTPLPNTGSAPSQPYYSPTSAAQQQRSRAQPARIGAGIVGGPGAGNIVKPFSDYQQLPIISPYLHLERPDGLDFDNYNTLVRPFAEQFQRNNQLQNEIRGLQNNLDQQYRTIQQMNRQMDSYQGPAQPRYFQDTGGFFPEP